MLVMFNITGDLLSKENLNCTAEAANIDKFLILLPTYKIAVLVPASVI